MTRIASTLLFLTAALLPHLAPAAPVRAQSEQNMITLDNDTLTVRYDAQQGIFTAARNDTKEVFLTEGRLVERDAAGGSAKVVDLSDALGQGKAVEVTWPDGRIRRLALYDGQPFVFASASVSNATDKPITVDNLTPLAARVDTGVAIEAIRGFGPEGPYEIDEPKTHFCFAAAVQPLTREGVVCGWVTHHRGSGVVTLEKKDAALVFTGQSQYGRMLVPPGAKAEGEVLAIGWFKDCLGGLEAYADACAKAHQVKLPDRVPSGYCTWYHARASNQEQLAELARFAGEKLKPYGFDFVQIDDGWQIGSRDFTDFKPNGPFSEGMKATAGRINAGGLVAGIWFIPFGWDPKCPALADHPDWFVHRPDGSIYTVTWAGSCLDMTNPDARAFVRKVVARMTRDWGYKYIKIDGLWTGMAVKILYPSPAYRPDELGQSVLHNPEKTQVEAYRDGLRLVREAAGPDVFILGCNIAQNARTLGGSIGLVDGMRIGHDIGAKWKSVRGCAAPTSHFYFFHHKVWFNDPDCLMLREPLTLDEARAWGSLIAISGQMNVVSEWLPGLSPERLDVVKRTMPNHNGLGRPVDLFDKPLPEIWHYHTSRDGHGVELVGLFNWDENQPADVTLDLAPLGIPASEKDRYVGFDFWAGEFIPPFTGKLRATLRSGSCQVIALTPYEHRPQLVSTSRHVTQGAVDVVSCTWDEKTGVLSGRSRAVAGDRYELRITAPPIEREVWTAQSATAASVDASQAVPATLKQTGPTLRVTIDPPRTEEIDWTVSFTKTPRPEAAALEVKNLTAKPLSPTQVQLQWEGRGAMSYEIRRGGQFVARTAEGQLLDEGVTPDAEHAYTVTARGWSGKISPPAKATVHTPAPPPPPPAPEVHLSDLKPLRATVGWGRAPQRDKSIGGNPMQVAGKQYARGMGVHAHSELVYALAPEHRRFVAVAGVDEEDSVDNRASVVFEVYTDDHLLLKTPVVRLGQFRYIDVVIPAGAKQLRLVVTDAGDGIACDHANWANAGFLAK